MQPDREAVLNEIAGAVRTSELNKILAHQPISVIMDATIELVQSEPGLYNTAKPEELEAHRKQVDALKDQLKAMTAQVHEKASVAQVAAHAFCVAIDNIQQQITAITGLPKRIAPSEGPIN